MPKADIHPTYYPNATVTCSCGASYVIGATKEAQKVDLCSNCHPFYSGNQKLIDTAGRVDRFREKMAAAQSLNKGKTNKNKEVVAEASAPQVVEEPTTEEVSPEVMEEAAEPVQAEPEIAPEATDSEEE